MKLTRHKSSSAAVRMGCWIALGLAMAAAAMAQGVSTTTVQGTAYLANGQPGAGTLVVSWPAFTTAAGQAVVADRMMVTIPSDGFVSVNLAPNQGATPAGEFYTAVYYMSDGSASTEYWVVPAAAQAGLAQVRAQVMPAAQAVQAVSKTYVDQTVSQVTQSTLAASGGTLSGPLYLNGDPTQPLQATDKHYVDVQVAADVPLAGGTMTGPLMLSADPAQNMQAADKHYVDVAASNAWPGMVQRADQLAGVDFGARLQACVNAVDPNYGGTCDARNFSGNQTISADLTIGTANTTVLLPCATIATANRIVVAAGARNVALRGCALRGGSAASGSTGGTVLAYSGVSAMVQVGDATYAVDTPGFHLDNVAINTTAAGTSAQGLVAYRTQEMDIESVYFLGSANQTGMTLDGTGNYTGGTFLDDEFSGFQTAVNGIGHQASNPATTDWVNASTFVRLHIDCPTANGNPVAGTYGINLQQGDGNTFTGGDVEGCATALHLGANAQNNTIIGLRNENSTSQVVADAGSAYNDWITGGTMSTGKLTDNGTRNSFTDTFHRSFNELNGDWYGSQQDATLTNHFRLGTGAGNERGLLDRYQTDYGYRWTTGFSDATGGEQYFQVLDELNNVNRLLIGQYNHGQSSTNNQTVINAAGTGAVVLNGSNNAGTGGVVFGSGGSSESTVATIGNTGNAQFNGTLQVGGTTQTAGTMTVRNSADAEVDYYLWPGLTSSQKGSFTYKDWNGNSQWYMLKDQYNNWALNSAVGGLDSIKAYQSTNTGDTYINASNTTGHIRLNYELGSGAETDIYSGGSASAYLSAAFLSPTAIKFPGLAASSGHNCLQIDSSGYITNSGSACGTGTGGGGGTVSSSTPGYIAYYTGNGSSVGGISSVPVTAGGTGAVDAADALANLGALALAGGTMSGALNGLSANFAGTVQGNSFTGAGTGLTGTGSSFTAGHANNLTADFAAQSAASPAAGTFTAIAASTTTSALSPAVDIRAYGAVPDGVTPIDSALNAAIAAQCGAGQGTACKILLPCGGTGCYLANGPGITNYRGAVMEIQLQGKLKLGSTAVFPDYIDIQGDGGGGAGVFQSKGPVAAINGPNVKGTMGTAVTGTQGGTSNTFTPTFSAGSISNFYVNTAITVAGVQTCSATATRTSAGAGPNTSFTLTSCTDSSGDPEGPRTPVGSLITVTGCSDSSFNVTKAPVNGQDWPNSIEQIYESGATSTATGCTVTGFDENTYETTWITGVAGGNLTALFAHNHAAADVWGMVGVTFQPGNYVHHSMENLNITGAAGVNLWLDNIAETGLTSVAVGASPIMQSAAVECDGCWQNSEWDHPVFNSATPAMNCHSNCTASYPYGLRCSQDAQRNNGIGCAFTPIVAPYFMGGMKIDGNGMPSSSGTGPNIGPIVGGVIEQSNAAGIMVDNRYGLGGPVNITWDQPLLQDDFLNNIQYDLGVTDQMSLGFVNAVLTAPYQTNSNLVNPYWHGGLNVLNGSGINNPANTMLSTGVITGGKSIEGDLRGIGAGFGPSLIPSSTLGVSSTISCATCSTVMGPDGAANSAVEVQTTAGGSAVQVTAGTASVSTYAGDYLIFGAWTQQGANTVGNGGFYGSNAFYTVSSSGTDTFFPYATTQPNVAVGGALLPMLNDSWRPGITIVTVQTGESTAHGLTFQLSSPSGGIAGMGNRFYGWFWMLVPGPNNPAYSGVTQPEVVRWAQQLLHGWVPGGMSAGGGILAMNPNHKMYWGTDTDLYRSAAAVVKSDGVLEGGGGVKSDAASCSSGSPWMRYDGTCGGPSAPGNVNGPGTSSVGDIVTWNSTTGTLVADSGIAPFVPLTLDFTTSTYPSGIGCSGTSPYTCTAFPTGSHICTVYVINGGGGGGSGAVEASGTNAYGGGGGTGGWEQIYTVPCSFFGGGTSATVTIAVGAGGTGGSAQSTNSSSGNGGGYGGISKIQGAAGYGQIMGASSTGTSPGSGGTTTTGTGGSNAASGTSTNNCGGGAGAATAAGGSGACIVTNSAPGGGAGGGGISSGTASAGGPQSTNDDHPMRGVVGSFTTASLTGGVVPGGNGQTPTWTNTPINNSGFLGSIGGTGGAGNCAGNGGTGGAGMWPGGGGGGGGGACNGYSSGAGGKGGDGIVRVIVQ